jgi:integrase
MANSITSKTGRAKLKPRREPYWRLLQKGQHLGYRKTKNSGHWIARRTENRKKTTHALTAPPDDYTEAKRQAEKWFDTWGSNSKTYLLQDAIDSYLRYLELDRSSTTLATARHTFRSISEAMMRTPVMKLTTQKLLAWRDSLRDGHSRANRNSVNRRWADLRAALNRAFHHVDSITSDTAWAKIQPYRGTLCGRDIFFSDKEVGAILDQAKELDHDFYNLCLAGLITGARVGELRGIRVRDFDAKDSSVKVDGKTGKRVMYLSKAARELFVECCEGKRASDYLLPYRGRKWDAQQHGRFFKKITDLPPGSVFYCLRHYYISKALVTQGVTVEMIAKNCGTSATMIEKFYGKFTSKQQRDTANLIEINI